jgi:hypothetical protein
LSLQNIDMALPVKVVSNGKEMVMLLDHKNQVIKSETFPAVDPEGWYLKRVIME